jgi:hypothetical protein
MAGRPPIPYFLLWEEGSFLVTENGERLIIYYG